MTVARPRFLVRPFRRHLVAPGLVAVLAVSASAVAAACSGSSSEPSPSAEPGGIPATGPWQSAASLPKEAQSVGDPERGRQILLNGSYMSCGIPLKLWDAPGIGKIVQSVLGAEGELDVPGREGRNAELPHTLNAFTTADGADVVTKNCLACHSGHFDGKLVIGLGNAVADFTGGLSGGAPTGVPDSVIANVGLNDAEKANLDKVFRVGKVFGPETAMRTIGMNPAEALTGTLLAHHDPMTLAWSDAPLREYVIQGDDGQPMVDPKLTSDPPPWWRAKKKNALFYNGMARGDHRGTMALASAVCVDTIEEATRVDALFLDMQAYIATIVAPKYARPVDAALAAKGKTLFTRDCAGCHGTYDADPTNDAGDTYPNLLVPLDVIGTDPAVANMGVVYAPQIVDWYNASFYGAITRAAPNDPFPGYMPPPLDGIWATGPFLHNGSVPTIELVLDSTARPAVWKRVDLDDTHFDEEALGWPWVAVPYPQASAPDAEKKLIYDTSYWSQSNRGHTFGDHLSTAERRAVIEYLKTL